MVNKNKNLQPFTTPSLHDFIIQAKNLWISPEVFCVYPMRRPVFGPTIKSGISLSRTQKVCLGCAACATHAKKHLLRRGALVLPPKKQDL